MRRVWFLLRGSIRSLSSMRARLPLRRMVPKPFWEICVEQSLHRGLGADPSRSLVKISEKPRARPPLWHRPHWLGLHIKRKTGVFLPYQSYQSLASMSATSELAVRLSIMKTCSNSRISAGGTFLRSGKSLMFGVTDNSDGVQIPSLAIPVHLFAELYPL